MSESLADKQRVRYAATNLQSLNDAYRIYLPATNVQSIADAERIKYGATATQSLADAKRVFYGATNNESISDSDYDYVGVAFNPLTLIAWKSAFWASDPSWTPPADGASVTSWRDAGTENKPATEATNPPVYRAAYTQLNNKPAVDFDGINDLLKTAAWGSNLTIPYSIIIVARSKTADNQDAHVAWDGNGVFYINGVNYRAYAGFFFTSTFVADTNPNFFHVVINDASSKIGFNGVQETGSPGSAPASFLAPGSNGAGAGFANIAIGFVGAVAGDITASPNWSALKSGFASYYGITIS